MIRRGLDVAPRRSMEILDRAQQVAETPFSREGWVRSDPQGEKLPREKSRVIMDR